VFAVKQTPEKVNLEVPPDVDPEGERRVKRGNGKIIQSAVVRISLQACRCTDMIT
jgi:hypothetical protein